MASDARLATPFIKRALATGTNLLQQYVGIGKAIEMTLLGEPLDAQEALRFGSVTSVVDPAELDAAADEPATRPANGPTAEIKLSKHAVYRGWDEDPAGAYWHQGSALAQACDLEDYAERVRAALMSLAQNREDSP